MTEPASGRVRFGSYQQFIDGHFEIARRIAGATRGDWNGNLDFTPYLPGGVILGQTQPDGTIELDQMNVMYALEGAFENPGVERSVEDRTMIRNALKTLFHEDNHLAVREGSRARAVSTVETLQDPGVRGLQEGITEAYSYAHLDRFVIETGFDELVPGILEVEGRSTYPGVAPAALELAEGIGGRAGLRGNDVLERLNRVDHEEKWQVATDLMYESSDLPGMVTVQERDAVKERIRAAMQNEFAALGNLRINRAEGLTEQHVRATSGAAGKVALANATAEIDRIERSYRDHGRVLEQAASEQEQSATGRSTAQERDAGPVQEDRIPTEPTRDEWTRPAFRYPGQDLNRERDRHDPVRRAAEPSRESIDQAREAEPRRYDQRHDADREDRDPQQRTADQRDPADRVHADHDPADRDPANRDADDRDPANRDAAGRDPANRDAADRDPANRDLADRDAADRYADRGRTDRELEPAERSDEGIDPQLLAPPDADSRRDRPGLDTQEQNDLRQPDRKFAHDDRPHRDRADRDPAERNRDARNGPDRDARNGPDRDARNGPDRADWDGTDRNAIDPNGMDRNGADRDGADRNVRDGADRGVRDGADPDQGDRATRDQDRDERTGADTRLADRDRDERNGSNRGHSDRGPGDREAGDRESGDRESADRARSEQGRDGRGQGERDRADGGRSGQRDPRGGQREGARQDQDSRGASAAAAAAPGGPPNDLSQPSRDDAAASARDPRRQLQQGRDQQSSAAKKAASAIRRAPQAAQDVLDAAEPTSSGQRRQQGRQQRGSGTDALRKLRDLTNGGQRSPQEAARPPSEHPQATPHGPGVHTAAQHNRRIRDQHRPAREQGEGRER